MLSTIVSWEMTERMGVFRFSHRINDEWVP